MKPLRPGQILQCQGSRRLCQVEELIGDGGQGEVYRVTLDGQPFALKWYNDFVLRIDRGLRQRLQTAIDIGAPSSPFLWPFELVALPDGSRLGYLMRLRKPGHQKIQAILSQDVRPNFRVLAMIGWQLAESFLALHAKGLAYQDLNAGNVFFDAATGAIEICDNDNVDIDGAPSVMGGVLEFQAPEVVLRQAGPSRATDLHSLAVMLFRLLHIGHPLVGRRELELPNLGDAQVMRRLYGSQPRFVFDPLDASNRPLPEHHGPVLGHWAIYPQALRALFTRAFTEGLHDPLHGRVQETEWRRAMRQLHDAVHTCPHCGAQNFYDGARLAIRQSQYPCWHCAQPLPSAPPRLGLRRALGQTNEAPAHVIVLEPGARIFAHHVGDSQPANAVVGEVGSDPADPGAICLHNRCSSVQGGGGIWQVQADGLPASAIGPGQGVRLRAGQALSFGAWVGSVRDVQVTSR